MESTKSLQKKKRVFSRDLVKIVKDVAEFYKNILDPIVYSNLTTNAEVFIR